MKLKILLCFSMFAVLACSGERKQAVDVLTRAAEVVEQNPDSALLLLDSISHPERLRKSLRMDYTLHYVQAKDKANYDITDDTAIAAAADFFVRKKSNEKAALALFYCGRVWQEQKRYKESAYYYLRAIDYAKLLKDKTLKGKACYNLGGLNREHLLVGKAIASYKQAYSSFCSKPDDYHRQAVALSAIGASFSVNKQTDSAFYYLEKGLMLAALHGDSSLQSGICQSIGVTFQVQGAAEKAHTYFLQALRLGVDADNEERLYRNLVDSHLSLGRRDSALLYMRLISQLNMQDTTLMGKAITQELLSNIEELQGHYKKALNYYKQYASYQAEEYENVLSNSVHEVEEKYRLEQSENEHNRKLILLQRVIMGLLGLMLAAALAYQWIYRRYLRLRERLRQQEQEMAALIVQAKALEDSEKQFKMRVTSLEAKGETLSDLREQRLDILKKASLFLSQLNPKDRNRLKNELPQFDQLVYGGKQGDDWQQLYESLNKLYGGVLDEFQQLLSRLSDTEFKVCGLSYAQFDNTEASIVLNMSGKTLLNHRTAIRKKLNIPEGGNIRQALVCLFQRENGNFYQG